MLTNISSTNNSSVCQAVLSASTLSASTAALSHVNTGSRYALPTVCFGPPRRPSACRQLSAELGFTEQQSAELLPPAAVLLWGCRGNLQPLLQRQIVVQRRENHTVVSRSVGEGEKRGRNPSEDFHISHSQKKTKQNGFVSPPKPPFYLFC